MEINLCYATIDEVLQERSLSQTLFKDDNIDEKYDRYVKAFRLIEQKYCNNPETLKYCHNPNIISDMKLALIDEIILDKKKI